MHKTKTIIGIVAGACAILAAAAAASQEASAQNQGRVRVPTVPAAQRQAGQIDVASPTLESQARRRDLGRTIAALDELIGRPAPDGLTRVQHATWNDQTAWLTSVRQRYYELSESYAAAEKNVAAARADDASSGESMANRMAQMNMQLVALQNAIQMESRKFQTLSNASKARHDTAMNSIRNMK